ncbi:membrane protein insertase YidC [Sporosarcina sp. GW1-11]|uniref:membrane protein insertase YidC n=1 Tax=Sporosarcina sp. GW1-11 TaxID=2899126 RepID=UPI00294C478F|nr:membrane protein insertase YidC [Sporosarcina sp. GW1-11]MDV6378825.1 membrane protein insertase YidC [Sporosarcina sp. GW1-11]
MKKKLVFLSLLVVVAVFMAGCSEFNKPITAESTGIWNEYIVWPLVTLIMKFESWLGTYGLAIIVVTAIIRTALLPLIVQQTKSSKRMQEIQPRLKALKEKYKSKDAVTQKKYQEEMQQIMISEKINPVAGCLPVLIQMPIFIGFYHAISRMNATPTIELGSILGVALGTPSIIFAIIAGLFQLLVLRTGPAMDNPQMKTMMYIMPFMIMVFGAFLPAALALYWIVGNIISLLQNIVIYKPFDKPKDVEVGKTGGKKK